MNMLKVTGYLSLVLAGTIFLFTETDSAFWGALPYLINAIFVFRYLSGNFTNKEAAVAGSGLMILLNVFASLSDPVGLTDAFFWILFISAWIKAEPVVATK